jgi:hypothetical protein
MPITDLDLHNQKIVSQQIRDSRRRNDSVSTVIGQGLDYGGIAIRVPADAETLLFSHSVQTGFGIRLSRSKSILESHSPGLNRPGLQGDHCSSSRAELRIRDPVPRLLQASSYRDIYNTGTALS